MIESRGEPDPLLAIRPTRNKPLTQRACFTLDLYVLMC
jgi:hypothetical protein